MIRSFTATAILAMLSFGAQAADAPKGYTKCAQNTGKQCSFSGTRMVAFGKNDSFVYATFTGGVTCKGANFPASKWSTTSSAWCSYASTTTSSSSSSVSSSSSSSVSSSSSSSSSSSNSSSSSSSSSSSNTGGNVNKQVGWSSLNGGTTGGAGGATVTVRTGTELNQALCSRASKTTPIIIRVDGTINHGNTTKVSGQCDTAADRISLKGIQNVSIIGVSNRALFDQMGIHIREARNIIIQNVHVRNVKKSGSPTSNGGDAIGMETNVSNVWVDHVTLEASGGEAEGYDGLFDMKDNTKYVTLSWSILKNSERGGLVGSGDGDDQNNFFTYHHNYSQNLKSRIPLLRHATAHSFNNYYNGVSASGMNPRIGGKIKAENNYFTNAQDPIGTFYTNDMGYWQVSGNIFAAGVTWTAEADKNHPAGPNPVSTTSISIPYAYTLDPAANVPNIVTNGAGAGKMP